MAGTSAPEMKFDSLPFGLKLEQLPEVVIKLRAASTKTMSGFDEIVMRGTGDVVLSTATMANDEPVVLTGRVDGFVVERLLRVLSAEGMESWDDVYPADSHDFMAKVLTVALNDDPLKEVMMCGKEFAEFSRAYGALKMAAGLARPEALSDQFFQRI